MSFFGLNRPEYVPAPELALAELAWSLTSPTIQKQLREFAPKGVAFGNRGNKPNKQTLQTKPNEGSSEFEALASALSELLALDESQSAVATRVLCDELEVYASQKTTRSTAAPLSLQMALLQDRRGITGKANPSNISLILEQIYSLGKGEGTAATCLLGAFENGCGNGLPSWIDAVVLKILPEPSRLAMEEIRGDTPVAPTRLA